MQVTCITLYPVGRRGARNPNPSCTREVLAQGRWDPSETAAWLGHRMSTVTHPSRRWRLWLSLIGPCRRRSARDAGAQPGAGRHEAGLEIAPQRDGELAGERDDGDLGDASLAVADALLEPAGERAVRLEAQPEPGELDQDGAGARIAGLADALLATRLAAVVGRSGDAGLLDDQPEAGMLAGDLGGEQRRQVVSVTGMPHGELRREGLGQRLDVADALPVQQRFD